MSDGIGNITSPLVAVNPRGGEGAKAPGPGVGLVRGEVRPEAVARTGSSTESTAPASTGPAIEAMDMDEVNQVVESINSYLQSTKRALEFSVDDASGRTVITVMDGEREEVIRQIPPEAVLALVERFQSDQELGGTGLEDQA
ncbi:flagellar protein FlaG [Thioalkalivibrio sp. ALE16]|uniref:flagellar protein FlaG n=1 Tax=Thioalkalivibrio sp. ALE16 TaxID=1158172 RepID=UPI0021012EC2|nr:flagellar protein FlaG [Thioalkalivibrio sp. ALE16]